MATTRNPIDRAAKQELLAGLLLRLRHSTLVHNIVSLYGTQIAQYLFPLVTVPYLARVLGVHQWGMVAFAQAFGAYVTLVVDFGFNLSATRDVARHRDDPARLSEILAGVLGAKLMLSTVCILAAWMVQRWVLDLRIPPELLWTAVAFGFAQAFSMVWFYQGLERIRTSAAVEVMSRALGVAGVFLLVRVPDHAWRVLAIQALASFVGTVILLSKAYGTVKFRRPSLAGSWRAMRTSSNMFLFRSAVSLYTSCNTLILGLLAPAASVGYYAGAEKLTRPFLGMSAPISQSVYPRVTYMVAHSRERAAGFARLTLLTMAAIGFTLGFLLWIAAPVLVRIVLGPGFQAAVPVLRTMSLLVPAIAISNVLGIQWMLPLGMERLFNSIILGAGLLNLGTAVTLGARFAHLGVAWSVAGCEWLISITMFVALWRSGLNPLSGAPRLAPFLEQRKQAAVSLRGSQCGSIG